MVGLYNIYDRGRTGVQIGNNKNLTDWTYVTNVADAHILAADKLSPASNPPVAGEIFFITNDEPIPFWDFTNGVWDRLDMIYPGKRVKNKPFIIPRTLGIMLGAFSELIAWLLRQKPTFTRFSVIFSCTARWHNIEKAKRALGYEPKVSLGEGMDILVDVRCLLRPLAKKIAYNIDSGGAKSRRRLLLVKSDGYLPHGFSLVYHVRGGDFQFSSN